MTCAQLFENHFCRTPDCSDTGYRARLGAGIAVYVAHQGRTTFHPAPCVLGRYLFMATFGVYCMTLYGRCAPSLSRCWPAGLSYSFMANLLDDYMTEGEAPKRPWP
ncbi:hypothetical protein [Arthrobacter globiformis]|uniref:hypothetical protein n=1 Tax=Arthrobacter globiformis TaxID=1665 RepID=UPI002790AAF9|nr:hypothetical protein [Arthrobacter globiformis]MDQ0618411.1 hypothetical protein [Arthrobacter globiformis]